MSESEGHSCPECGAPRGPDLSPSCDCAERAAEALRETRTAEAAAAEDFDPLRIRPYVRVEAVETTPPLRPSAEPPPSTTDLRIQRPEEVRDRASACDSAAIDSATARQPDDGPPRIQRPEEARDRASARDSAAIDSATARQPDDGPPRIQRPEEARDRASARDSAAIDSATARQPDDGPPRIQRPEEARDRASARDSAAIDSATARQPDDGPPRPSRRSARRTVLLSVAGAVTAAGFAGGLLSYHTPSRDRAAQEVRASVPEVSTPGPASPTARSASPAAPRSPVPPPAASASLPSPPATRTTSPTPAPSTATTRPAAPTASATARATPALAPVLQRGDHGPEVTELQYRLRQLNLYGDEVNGVFTPPVEDAVRTYQLARGIRGDALGVYGPATRKSLEAETSEP